MANLLGLVVKSQNNNVRLVCIGVSYVIVAMFRF